MNFSIPKFTILMGYYLCLISCNNNAGDSKATVKTATDTSNEIKAQYANNLIDLSGNKNMNELLCQGWEFSEDLENLPNSSEAEGMLPFRSFYLSPDSTYIRNPRNLLEYGRWRFDNATKMIVMQERSGAKTEYKLGGLAAKELVVVKKGESNDAKLRFVSSGKRYRNASNDPFHISNNLWRVAPKKAENDAAIKQRLKGFIHFHILFYRDNLAKDEKAISFYGLPTCVKWYAGGIFIIKEKDLPSNWIQCFFNKEQAQKARLMMEEIVSKKYHWPKGNISWVIKNLNVLEQMYEQL